MLQLARRGALLLAAALIVASCGPPSAADQRADLCNDLLHLRATIALLVSPPEGSTVGQIRSALDKLDPTFERVDDSTVVSAYDRSTLRQAQSDYRSYIDGLGDDEPISVVAAEAGGPAALLGAAFESVLTDLSCAQGAAGSPQSLG